MLGKEHPEDIINSLHLYFSGLPLRNTSKAISRFVTRSHTAIRDWIQKYKPERLFHSKIETSEFIIDEKLNLKPVLNTSGFGYLLLNLKAKKSLEQAYPKNRISL